VAKDMKNFFVACVVLVAITLACPTLAVTKEGGVEIETIQKAAPNAECAVVGDTVVVHYTGRLKNADGKVFDSSRKNAQPFEFTLGKNNVIPGWEVGVEGMCVGEIRSIVAPPTMAYGDRGYSPIIPPKATLWFEVELLTLIPGAAHPRSISLDQIFILAPLIIIVVAIAYFGFKLLSAPDKGKIQKKDKKK
jgi:hypothetical protein